MRHTWRDSLLAEQLAIKNANLWRHRTELSSSQQPRVEIAGRQVANFASNDYLGLANHPRLVNAISTAVAQWGAGSGASHMVCGHQTLHHQLEQALAEFVGAERALLFSTGYMANLAICNAFVSKHDLILQDKLNHASLIDGAAMTRARARRYAHADCEHAEQILGSEEFDRSLIVSDSVFSMDGDVASIVKLKKLADQYNGLLVLDDAHGFGVLGHGGAGALDKAGVKPADNVLMMGTLGKACGSFGAFIAGDGVYIEQLIQKARSYIYTTALPPSTVAASVEAIRLIQDEGVQLISQLNANIERFRQGIAPAGLSLLASSTPIQPLMLGSETKALEVSAQLLSNGYYVSAIRPPTVPKGTSRLRVTLSAGHSASQIDGLVAQLAQATAEASNG